MITMFLMAAQAWQHAYNVNTNQDHSAGQQIEIAVAGRCTDILRGGSGPPGDCNGLMKKAQACRR